MASATDAQLNTAFKNISLVINPFKVYFFLQIHTSIPESTCCFCLVTFPHYIPSLASVSAPSPLSSRLARVSPRFR
jgi:hypothetical protein